MGWYSGGGHPVTFIFIVLTHLFGYRTIIKSFHFYHFVPCGIKSGTLLTLLKEAQVDRYSRFTHASICQGSEGKLKLTDYRQGGYRVVVPPY